MRWLLVLALIPALVLIEWLRQPIYHAGPMSDHFDGTRFHQYGRTIGKGLIDVIQWQWQANKAQWPDAVPTPPSSIPPRRVGNGELRVTWVGHATLLVQADGFNLLTDPIWAERASLVAFAGPRRVAPPGIRFDDLPPIDAVLISHSHFDHMDLPTLQRLQAAHDPLFITALGTDAVLLDHNPEARSLALDWWQAHEPLPGLRVHAVPVQHWSRRRLFDRNLALWAGFAIETVGGRLYFGGDSGFGDGRHFREAGERLGPFRLAMLPIGAYEPRWFMKDQHVNPEEAVQAHRLLRAEQSLGMHFGTFQLTDEAIDAPLTALRAARARAGLADDAFVTVPIGGAWVRPAATQALR